MKKVALFITTMYPSGGAEQLTHRLGNELSKTYDVSVISMGTNTFSDARYKKVILTRYDTLLRKVLAVISAPLLLRRICRQEGIDVVISHMEIPNYVAIMGLAHTSVPVLATIHNVSNYKRGVRAFFSKRFYPKANTVITVSQGLSERVQQDLRLSNVTTISNFVDREHISQQLVCNNRTEDRELFSSDMFTYITIGRLVAEKDHAFMLKAFAEVLKKRPDSQLIIVGEGPERARLERLCLELTISESVHLLGTRDNVFPLLRESDAFVLTSKEESFGLVLLEAQLSSLPVVSTNCPTGPRELLIDEREQTTESYAISGSNIVVPLGELERFVDAMIEIRSMTYVERDLSFVSTDQILEQWNTVIEQ